jgi:1-acyl-sn-glycerol-3-phosphate acyltransferase
MTSPASGAVGHVPPPSWHAAAHARNLAAAGLRMTYRVRAHGAHHVGTTGALILVTRSEGILVGALLHALAPRPIHVLANEAMSQGIPDAVLARTGDIPVVAPTAVGAQQAALAALADERVVVVAGAAVPVGYLVARTGVDVMPVVLIGADGRVPTDPPRPRSRIDVYFAPAVSVSVPGDPLRASTRAAVTEQVRQIVSDAEDLAAMRAGLG